MATLERIAELAARYDRNAPRYTSYPAVPYWGAVSSPQAEAWLEGLQAQPDEPLSLYTHLPFCESRCWYCGCFVVITPHREPIRRYLEQVQAEMALVRRRLPESRPVAQYHLGGGTPTYLKHEEMETLVGRARALFAFAPDAELSIEVDPRTMVPADLRWLRELGFNRLSFGVQDFDPDVQAGVNRVHPYEDVAALVAAARAEGFLSVNFDLIYGLPHQTPERFAQTLERVTDLCPDRLALYSFAYLPGMFSHHKRLDAEALPAPRTKLGLALQAEAHLLAHGYAALGLDHYAHRDDELAHAHADGRMVRNFMGYTTRAGHDLLGFGASAISELAGCYWQNEKRLSRYEASIEAGRLPAVRGLALSSADMLRREVIQAIFCEGRIPLSALQRRFGGRASTELHDALAGLESMIADGLLREEDGDYRVTSTGRHFLRNIAACFDAYAGAGAAGKHFSRAI